MVPDFQSESNIWQVKSYLMVKIMVKKVIIILVALIATSSGRWRNTMSLRTFKDLAQAISEIEENAARYIDWVYKMTHLNVAQTRNAVKAKKLKLAYYEKKKDKQPLTLNELGIRIY